MPFLAALSGALPFITNMFNKPAGQDILGALGSSLIGKGMDKIFGVPTPPIVTGKQIGRAHV